MAGLNMRHNILYKESSIFTLIVGVDGGEIFFSFPLQGGAPPSYNPSNIH